MSDNLDCHCNGVSAAEAERREAFLLAAVLERVDEGRQNPRAGAADGVAQRHCAAVDVEFFGIYLEFVAKRDARHAEGLVEFDEVKIIDVDREKRKIRLTRRDLVPDPWDEIEKQYKPGDVVDGVVVRVTTFGAFIKIDNYYEGLAHISELVDNKINHAKEVFSPGDRVPVMILEIDTKRKRIRLSAKKAVEKQARREVDAYLKQQEDIRNIPHISTEATEALRAVVSQPPSPVEEPVIKPTPSEVFASPEPAVEQFKESPPEVEAAPAVEEGVSEPQVVAPRPDVEIASYAVDEAPEDIPVKDPDEVLVNDPLPTTPEPAAAGISTAFDGGIDDEERDLISGEEYDDTGQPDLPSNPNSRGEGDEIDLIEGSELEDK